MINRIKFVGPLLLTLGISGYSKGIDLSPSASQEQGVVKGMEMSVPENWNKTGSRKISLPVKVYHSSDPNSTAAIFWLSGGPGQTNLEYEPPASLLRKHDVVLVGFRGVDGNSVLKCPEVVQALKGVDNNLLSKSSVLNFQSAVANCAQRLQHEGVDLDGYTIEQVIKDLEHVRQELGYETISLLSASYGTRVALLYAQNFPNRIDKSVLIGANGPGRFVWERSIITDQIKQLSVLCANDPRCAERTNSLETTFSTVFENLPDHWLFFPIDAGKTKVTAFALLYHTNTAAMAVDALISAQDGDYSGMALMSNAYDFILPNMMVWGDFFSKGFIDYDSSRNYYHDFESKGLGSPLSSLVMDAGKYWPTKRPTDNYLHLVETEVNTLILSGSLDFSTPAQNATLEIMPFLKKGTQIIFKNRGHVADLLYDSMIISGIGHYFEDSGINFPSQTVPFDFEPRGIFTLTAKVIVFFLMIISLLVVFLLYKLIKRYASNP